MTTETRHGTLAELAQRVDSTVDVFICSASFEERCLSIARSLDRDRIGHVVIFRNQRFMSTVEENATRLQERFAGKESVLVVDSGDPVLTTKNIVAAIAQCRELGAKRILIDITTFTHETLLILFRVCDAAFDSSCVVEFLYATAKEYSIGDPPGAKWLSKGIREVRSVMGYPGGFVPSRGTHLIVLAGFEAYRALSLVRELEPSLVSIGYGDRAERSTTPHQDTNERNVERIQDLIRNLVGRVEEFVFSCYDSFAAERAIRSAVGSRGAYNTILAPMNTKLSTLGAGRVALTDESVQICYAQADIYNCENYSEPGTEFYFQRFADYPAAVRM